MKLKVYLATIDMTLKDFSKILGCRPEYLSNIMHGRIIPGERLAKDICQLTEGQVNFLKAKDQTASAV